MFSWRRAAVKNSEEENCVAEVYCMAGRNSVALRAALDLLEQILAEPFYDNLRTKEQLGYSVHCSTRLTHGILGFAFVVNSGAHQLFCQSYAHSLQTRLRSL
jgi:nardilysin